MALRARGDAFACNAITGITETIVMPPEQDLRAELRRYDGGATATLAAMDLRFGTRRGYLDSLVTLAGDPERPVSDGATWMLKSALEAGRQLTPEQTARLLDGLDAIVAWQARLHVCQCAAHLDVPADRTEAHRRWLMPLLSAGRPFLRAWALDALCHLDGTDCAALLERMGEDPAASVRARVRNLRKRMV